MKTGARRLTRHSVNLGGNVFGHSRQAKWSRGTLDVDGGFRFPWVFNIARSYLGGEMEKRLPTRRTRRADMPVGPLTDVGPGVCDGGYR